MTEVLSQSNKDLILEIIKTHKNLEGGLINVLNDVQEEFGHIPYPIQAFVAEEMDIPLTEVYGVVTFYSRFSLDPVGEYKVGVCMGTACYVRGADKLLEEVEKLLGIKAGETSEDGKFSIEPTRCIGACGLAPIVVVNEDVYGNLEVDEVKAVLEKYQ